MPGLLDFFMYCIVSNISDIELYGLHKIRKPVLNFVFGYLQKQQNEIIELMKTDGNFTPPTPIAHTMDLIKDFMGFGTKMGEGWLAACRNAGIKRRGRAQYSLHAALRLPAEPHMRQGHDEAA